MRGRRLWVKVEAHGRKIPFYVVKELLNDEGDDLDGVYYYEHGYGCIRQIDDKNAMKQTLHHELMHVAMINDPTMPLKRQHELIDRLETPHYDILVRNGWLRYPNPPRLK
jgi:hypothetical protein